jgi:hypothetical protein
LIWPGNGIGFEGDLAACAPWSQQLLRIGFRASYKPVMSMTRPTKPRFFVDITRVYTMTGLAERGTGRGQNDPDNRDRRIGPQVFARRGSRAYLLAFFRLARMVGGYVDRRVFPAGCPSLPIFSPVRFTKIGLGLPARVRRIGPEWFSTNERAGLVCLLTVPAVSVGRRS